MVKSSGELTTYQGDKVEVGELVLFGMFGDRGMLVGGTEQDAMVAQIKTKDGVLVGFREPVSVKSSFRKYHGDWTPTSEEQTLITAMRAEVVKSEKEVKPNRKPLKDMSTSEVQQLRVILRILPDSTLWITEEGTDSLERNVASWNPAHRPDRTEKSWVGGYILGHKVSDNAADWLRKVAKTFNLNKDDIVAEAWRGGGLRHKGVSPFSFVKGLRGIDKSTDASETSPISLQSIHDSRSPRSRESDEHQSNADTIEPDDPRVERWLKDPGSSDIVGIDTPRKHKSKKVARKIRKSTRTETQVRGIRK